MNVGAREILNQGLLPSKCQPLLSMVMLSQRPVSLKFAFLIPMNPWTDKSHTTLSLYEKVIPILVMLFLKMMISLEQRG
jgi:hypothetical protein